MSLTTIRKANSWKEFTALLAPLGRKQRGNAFELLTELLLQIDPVYRSKLKYVWHESNLPSSVRNKLGLPQPEIGVDLVAETYTGEYWAIQCKYHHDPTRNLTYGELKSFLDITSRVCAGKFSNLLAVSSAHGYSVNLQKHAPEVQYCLSDRFQGLDQDFFKQARRMLRKQTPKFSERTPRPHQATAIDNAIEHFITNRADRGKLIHPCGTGKSLIGYWIAEALEAKTILVALPSLYLVRQTLTDWTKESLAKGQQLDWMVVCSEDTISDLSRGDPSMRFQEIGVDVTTDIDRIAKFLRKRSEQKVIFTTYQSGYVTAEAARKAKRIFDVGVFDEAHRTVGQKDALFSHLISDENIRIRKRVFMTATERRYRGSSDTILSMDDVDAYGDTFDLMTFKEALEQKKPILSDYRVVTMFTTRAEVQELIDQNFLVKPDKGVWNDDTEARTLAALIALRKVMRQHGANHALTFHNSIAKAEAFQKSQISFNRSAKGYGKVDCFHVSSKVSTGERKAELDRFKDSKKALITNAKCLTEGVDVPTIDAVLFADTKRSTIDIVQAAGRALRVADGKKMGFIIVPVLVDENAPDAADKAFQDILMTLRALAANDDRIIDYFRSISQGKRPKKSDAIIEFNVPDPVRVKLENFIECVETETWHRLAKLSWMPFEEARGFARSQKLKRKRQWTEYTKGKLPDLQPLPKDIPISPQSVYKNKGWEGFRDWLGSEYREFEKAREFARSLNLKNTYEWYQFAKGEYPGLSALPEDVPVGPFGAYKTKGWVGWGDWLGTGRVANSDRKFREFNLAREFVRSLGIRNKAQWRKYAKGKLPDLPPLPDDIPIAPDVVYKNLGWEGIRDWLGTEYRELEKAREFVHSLGLNRKDQWIQYTNSGRPDLPPLPKDIPVSPSKVYKDKGWTIWGEWLGTGRVAPKFREFREFEKAREFARSLGLNGQMQWRKYAKGKLPDLPPIPEDVPSNVSLVYRDKGWISWGDWLGTGTVAPQYREYRNFKAAREFAHSLHLMSSREWGEYVTGDRPDLPPLPRDIPSSPHKVYKDEGWISSGDWLGTGRVALNKRVWRNFKNAREFARSLQLGTTNQWKNYSKGEVPNLPPLPSDVPTDPYTVYQDAGWKGYRDWLGNEYRNFKAAREFAHSLHLETRTHWEKYTKGERPDLPLLPRYIPAWPNKYYKDKGWISWPDWLGTSRES